MKKLEKKELLGRAKKLYFDRNKNIESVFVDEYGRFSYSKAPLLEANKGTDVGIFQIKKDAVKNMDVKEIKNFAHKEHVEQTFGKNKK